MINLHNKNGNLNIGDLCITPEMCLQDITELKRNYDVVLAVENGDYISYRLPNFDEGKLSFIFYFYKEKISSLGIGLGSKYAFPPFEITEEERREIKKLLETIGGERNYSWGSVYYSEDSKGGSISVGIKYDSSRKG